MDAAAPVVPTPPVIPAPPVVETVSLPKAEHDQLAKDAARASEALSRADRYEVILKKNGLLGTPGHFRTPAAPVAPATQEERDAQASAEDRKAERGLLALAADPALRDILDKDPTLRTLLTTNPLAVLPMYANDALDADDAVSLVREALLKKAAPASPPVTPPPPPPTPPSHVVNPPDAAVNEEVEAARKHPNVENAIAGMIGAKARASLKK